MPNINAIPALDQRRSLFSSFMGSFLFKRTSAFLGEVFSFNAGVCIGLDKKRYYGMLGKMR
jgi:hypothetical protein